jgi:hypothetical protein
MYTATSWGYRHPRVCTGLRIATATWNLIAGLVLATHGYWGWAVVLLAVSAFVFCAAYLYARGYSESRRKTQS